jgi:predicted GIY-YIG superfamily endonuclease
MITYILKCENGEYYCGKTKDLDKRLDQHRKEKYPHWFCNDNRRNFTIIWKSEGDYEKKIKAFGVKLFVSLTSRGM